MKGLEHLKRLLAAEVARLRCKQPLPYHPNWKKPQPNWKKP
jgi:hypothetical protein